MHGRGAAPLACTGGHLGGVHTVRTRADVDQALAAARAITDAPALCEAVPWFWSNQYDLQPQTVGLSTGYDAPVVRGEPAARSFSVVYLRRSAVIALGCVNAMRDSVQGKALGPAVWWWTRRG